MEAMRRIDDLVAFVRRYGGKGLAHVSVAADGTAHSPIAKFLGEERIAAIVSAANGKPARLATQPPGSVPHTTLVQWLNEVTKTDKADFEIGQRPFVLARQAFVVLDQ